jgi:hypothetical protein
MKRMISPLILATFLLGFFGGQVTSPDIQARLQTCPHSSPRNALYLPYEGSDSALEVVKQPVALYVGCSSFLCPVRGRLSTWQMLRPIFPKPRVRVGLGCGGLPS